MNSMTGFGVARGKIGRSHVVVEVRSVNHRFCEVNLRFPGRFQTLEPEVQRRVRQFFSRGKFDLYLREETREKGEQEILLARKAHQLLKRIQRDLSIKSEMTLSDLLAFRGILFTHQPQDDLETIRRPLMKLAEKALEDLRTMRASEGRGLKKWFERRVKRMIGLLGSIERQSRKRGPEYRRRLDRKLKGMENLDETRLMEEAGIMAERADVTEEIVRLRSHLREFQKFLKEKEPIGRKSDFLAQEMGREINTIGSKVQGVGLAHQVIEFKAELERIREQVQNVE